MDKEAIFSHSDEGGSARYSGPVGATTFEPVHWTAPSGNVISVRVYRVINAATDPVLAQRLVAGTLNWVRLEEDDQLYPVRVPVVYHDPARRLFALLLPEDFRCREIEERASLLNRLAEDRDHALPRYVLNFHVLYGHESLQEFLDGSLTGRVVETTPVRAVSREQLRRSASSESMVTPDPMPRSGATDAMSASHHQGDYEVTGKVLEVSEEDLLAVEDLPSNRDEEGSPGRSGTGGMARAVLQAEAEAVLEGMEGMDGWPSGRRPGSGRDLIDAVGGEGASSASDAAVTKVARVEDMSSASGPAGEAPASASSAADLGDRTGQGPLESEAASHSVGQDEPTQESPEEPGSSLSMAGAEQVSEPVSEPELGPESERELPEPLADWQDSGKKVRFYVETGEETAVVLAAKGSEDAIMGFLGSDADVLVQLHELPTYPLVVLGAHPKERPDLAFFWLLDVLDDSHLDVLDRLTEDFRVQIDIYDESYRRQASMRAHYPLEENTKLIRKTAMEHLTAMGDTEPDFEAARAEWSREDFPRLGDREHAFSVRSFEKIETPSQAATALGIVEWWADSEHEPYLLLVKSFPAVWWRKIKNRVVKAALEFGLWPPQALVDFALVEGLATSKKDLVRHCLDRFCQTSQGAQKNDLDVGQEHENWTRLLAEAKAAGIVPSEEVESLAASVRHRMEAARALESSLEEDDDALPLDDADIVEEDEQRGEPEPEDGLGRDVSEPQEDADGQGIGPLSTDAPLGGGESSGDDLDDLTEEASLVSSDGESDKETSASLRDLSNPELVELLDDKDRRLAAALVLSERRDPSTISALFDAIARMTRSEVLEVLPGFVAFGAAVEAPLIALLSSNKSFLRQGAALALGILRSGPAMEALVDCLLAEPTGIWREVARVVGEMGKSTVMILASRLRTASAEGRERIAWALAHVASISEDTRFLVELTHSEDDVMASVARRALDLVDEARAAAAVYEREPGDDESVVVTFTRAFFKALTHDVSEVEDEDILDGGDLQDQ